MLLEVKRQKMLSAIVLMAAIPGVSGTASPSSDGLATATFAGGCFWCMEHPFDELEGVVSTTVGYTGGEEPDPTHREVSAGKTGHDEAVRVRYDPEKIGYEKLLDVFRHNVDPLTRDRGDSTSRS